VFPDFGVNLRVNHHNLFIFRPNKPKNPLPEAMESKKEIELRVKEAIWTELDSMKRTENEPEERWRVQNHTNDANSDEEDESSDDDSCDKEEEERMRKRLKREWKRKKAKKLLKKQARKLAEAEAYFDRQVLDVAEPFPVGEAKRDEELADRVKKGKEWAQRFLCVVSQAQAPVVELLPPAAICAELDERADRVKKGKEWAQRFLVLATMHRRQL
jgi:hypothetical protein